MEVFAHVVLSEAIKADASPEAALVLALETAGVALTGDADDLASLGTESGACLLYTSPSPRDQRGSRMPSSA